MQGEAKAKSEAPKPRRTRERDTAWTVYDPFFPPLSKIAGASPRSGGSTTSYDPHFPVRGRQ
jgi:hypothetical protein